MPKLLRLIARGRPTTPEEIASATGARVEEVEAMFRSMPDAELDEDGDLVGMGLTLRATDHRFAIEGRQLFTWCALDTLIYPSLLGTSAVIESPCRATGDPIRVEVGPAGVGSVEPEGRRGIDRLSGGMRGYPHGVLQRGQLLPLRGRRARMAFSSPGCDRAPSTRSLRTRGVGERSEVPAHVSDLT